MKPCFIQFHYLYEGLNLGHEGITNNMTETLRLSARWSEEPRVQTHAQTRKPHSH